MCNYLIHFPSPKANIFKTLKVSGNAAEFRAKLLAEMDVYCPPNPDLEHLYIPPFDGDYLSQFPPFPPPFDEDDSANPQNEPPEKRSPPSTPPGEVDAEPYTTRREKREKRKKDLSEVPQSPPSPPTATTKGGRNRKANSAGLFRKNARGEGKKITPSSHKDTYPWSPEEDEALTNATRTYGLNWDLACEVLLSNPSLPSRKFMRTPTACAERYRTVLQPRAAGEGEKDSRKSPPSSPLMSPQQAQQPHFGILDVIRNMVNQKKDIPGMIGSAAQTDQSVPPHASHLQAAMHAGITSNKPLTPRDVIALLSQRVTLTMPQKDIPVLTKLAYKMDPKISGFGQGLGLMGSTMANAIAGANQPIAPGQSPPQPNTMVAGPAAISPNNPVAAGVGAASTFTVPNPSVVGGVVGAGVPASNSIILNPNGGNVQTSRKLAQINQSMLPTAPNVSVLPRANSSGSVPTVNAAPAVVVAIPTNTPNVAVLPRANSTNAIPSNPVAPTVNMTTPTPVLPSATPQPPVPATTGSKPSPSKRSKKNAENANGGGNKRQRTKNAAPQVAEQPQPIPAQPQPAQPLSQPAQPQPTQPQPTIMTHPQHPQTQPQPQTQGTPLQHQQMHQLQQIQHQLQQQHLQHQQQPHMSLQQPQSTQLPQQALQQPQVASHIGGQPQHLHPQSQPTHMHPQYQQPQTQPQPTAPGQQPQPNPSATPQYTTPAYSTATTYATGPAYTAPTNYTTPSTGITYATTYTTPTYTTPSSAPSSYTTPTPATYTASAFTNSTAPGSYNAPAYTGTTPATTYATVPATTPATYTTAATPATYVAPTAARPFTTATAGSTFTGAGAPATYIATGAPGGSFTTPASATTPYTASTVGYTPQGMVIGVPQQPTMIGTIPPNALKRAAQPNAATSASRPGASAQQPSAGGAQNAEILAMMCTSQFPASTNAVQGVLMRKDLTEDQRVEAVRKIMSEHTPM